MKTASVMDVEALLYPLSNMFGRLDEEVCARLKDVVSKPSRKSWDNAYSLILNSETSETLWSAVMAVDPTFQSSRRSTPKGIGGWLTVPTRDVLIAALRHANPVQHDTTFTDQDVAYLASMGVKA